MFKSWIVGSALAAAMVALGLYYYTKNLSNPSEPGVPLPSYDSMINLGPLRLGKIVQARVVVKNEGSAPLDFDGWRADCSCIEIYTVSNGVRIVFKSHSIKPGESIELFSDVRSTGEVGVIQRQTMFLSTNSGEITIAVQYLPVAHVYTYPSSVNFGLVKAGQKESRRLEVKSDGTPPRDMWQAVAQSRLFAAKFTPVEAGAIPVTTSDTGSNQFVIGYVDISLTDTLNAKNNSEEVVLSAAGKEFLRVPVSCYLQPPISASPDHIILPRTVNGKRVYKQLIYLRPSEPVDFSVSLATEDRAVFSLSVKMDTDVGRAFELEYTGPRNSSTPKSVRLSVKTVGSSHALELPVIVLDE